MRHACLAALALAAASHAQITPDRTYYGVGRPIPCTVSVPDDAAGDPELLLFRPDADTPHASAPVTAGAVDLAALFPSLYASSDHTLLYVQLAVDAAPVGPALVLQPLLSPPYAVGTSSQGYPVFQRSPDPVFSGYRAYVDQHVVFDTSHGQIEFRLRPDHAPNTCFNFMHLVAGGFYTDIPFHRIIAGDPPFVIQAGDPTGTGAGGPGYMIDLEDSRLPHDFGVLSMARTNDPNTNGSQVFICLSRQATQALDRRYTAFAQAVRGADAILRISQVPLDGERPQDPMPTIRSARLVDAPPFPLRPKPLTPPQP